MSEATRVDACQMYTIGCDEALPGFEAAGLIVCPAPSVALTAPGETTRGKPLVAHVDAIRASGRTVEEFVAHVRESSPDSDLFIWAPEGEPDMAQDAIRSGAADVILDRDPEALVAAVRTHVRGNTIGEQTTGRMLEPQFQSEFEGLFSCSNSMRRIFDTCVRVAPTEATVLLLGETGTGKELLARAIHKHSSRPGRFVAVNCGAVPEALIESELFGHEKGSFTGATGAKPGLFRAADKGTLLLDEVGDLPASAQLSLLRALQEGKIRPVGGSEEMPVDVRVIAATSVPLYEEVEQGRFREDLLYRLDVIRIVVPPLRDRPEDILHLFAHFVKKLSDHHNLRAPTVSQGFEAALKSYPWPGNVRQLENFTERLLLTEPGAYLTIRHFHELMRPYHAASRTHHFVVRPTTATEGPPSAAPSVPGIALPEVDITKSLSQIMNEVEKRYLEAALRENEGRIQATANTAGLSRRTLLRKIKKHKVDKRDFM